MNKKQKRNWIIIGLVLIVAGIFAIPFFLTIIDANTRTFKWKGFDVIATSDTSFGGKSTGCSDWAATVSPTEDTSGTLTLQTYSNYGQCKGGGASSTVLLRILQPKKYKSIFIKMSGNAGNGGYSGTSSCPSASISSSLSQEGSNSVKLFSSSISCVGTSFNIPTGILLNIENNFIIIPAIQENYQLQNDSDLIISFSVSASGNENQRSANANLYLEDIQTTLKEVIPQCQQLLGQLCNLQESKIVSYSTDCERDELLKQGTYITNLDQCQSYCQNEQGQLCKPDVLAMFTIVDYSNVCEKEDLLSQGYQADLSKCDMIIPPPRDNKTLYIVGGSILSLSILGYMFRKKLGRMI